MPMPFLEEKACVAVRRIKKRAVAVGEQVPDLLARLENPDCVGEFGLERVQRPVFFEHLFDFDDPLAGRVGKDRCLRFVNREGAHPDDQIPKQKFDLGIGIRDPAP